MLTDFFLEIVLGVIIAVISDWLYEQLKQFIRKLRRRKTEDIS
jgi:uncharacterized membrane protein YeaQ/YmgE (transglycosylase-associated protein family)